MSLKKNLINPKSMEDVKLKSVVGTPDGNAVVVGLHINGVSVQFSAASGKFMRRTGRGIESGGKAKVATPLRDLGYYRYDQLTAPSPTFRRPAGIVAEDS